MILSEVEGSGGGHLQNVKRENGKVGNWKAKACAGSQLKADPPVGENPVGGHLQKVKCENGKVGN